MSTTKQVALEAATISTHMLGAGVEQMCTQHVMQNALDAPRAALKPSAVRGGGLQGLPALPFCLPALHGSAC